MARGAVQKERCHDAGHNLPRGSTTRIHRERSRLPMPSEKRRGYRRRMVDRSIDVEQEQAHASGTTQHISGRDSEGALAGPEYENGLAVRAARVARETSTVRRGSDVQGARFSWS